MKVRIDPSLTLVATATRSVARFETPLAGTYSPRSNAEPGDEGRSAHPVATVMLDSKRILVVATGEGVTVDRPVVVELLRESNPDTPIVFAKCVGSGRASAEFEGDVSPAEAAAATAVVQASWAWDESESIVVAVGLSVFATSLRFEDEAWHVSPTPADSQRP